MASPIADPRIPQRRIGRLAARAAASVVLALSQGAPAYAQMNAQEREAVKVVKEWMAAFATHDVGKIASYMTDDVAFRADSSSPIQRGRDRFILLVDSFISAIVWLHPVKTFVVSGKTDTVVLSSRVDKFNNFGSLVPAAAFFRVKNGKIEEWIDVPLVDTLPPPPGGFPDRDPRSGGAR